MAKKWIINENRLVLGNVPFHFNLASSHKNTKGGGRYYYEKESNTLILFGESGDFGKAKLEDVKNSKKEGCFIYENETKESELMLLDEVVIVFSEEEFLSVALKRNEIIQTPEICQK